MQPGTLPAASHCVTVSVWRRVEWNVPRSRILPLDVLDLSPEQAETFAMWGITTLGELAKLEEIELIARLGQPGKELRLLARGESPHLFTAIEPTLTLEERIELDSPIELLDSLLFVMGVMLDQLIVRAQTRILAMASITLLLDLEGGTSHTCTVRPALPNNDRKLWLKLMHLELQAHPPPGSNPVTYLEGTTGQHQQSTAWTFFSPGTGTNAAGCNASPDSQHCRRGVRGAGGA